MKDVGNNKYEGTTLHKGQAFFIIAGTTPISGRGGISTALRGLLQGFRRKAVPHVYIATHDPNRCFRQFLPFLKALPRFIWAIAHGRRYYKRVYLFVHPGSSISPFRKYLLLLLGNLSGCYTITQVHSPNTAKYLRTPIKRLFLKIYFSSVDKILVLTPWWELFFLSEGIGKGKISVLPNAIDQDLNHCAGLNSNNRTALGNDVIILSMARFVDGKGIDLVIQSLKFLPEKYKLKIAGDGPNRQDYENLAVKEGVLSRITFEGWVDDNRKAELFLSANIFCLPSRHDSFGMVYIEAMSYGLPVVALDFGPIADVVPNGIVGVLVGVATPQSIADAISSLSSNEDYLVKREACKTRVAAMYTPEVVICRLMEILGLI